MGSAYGNALVTIVNGFYGKGGSYANSKSIESHICKALHDTTWSLFTQVGQFLSSFVNLPSLQLATQNTQTAEDILTDSTDSKFL